MIIGLVLFQAWGLSGQMRPADVVIPPGSWLETGVRWQKPPAELSYLHEQFAEAGILFFAANHRFLLVYGTVLRQPNNETLSQGDGRVVYIGTWKTDGSRLRVEYQLVERTVRREGEQIPGPMLTASLQTSSGHLILEGKRFERDARLDPDLRAILEGSAARHAQEVQE